MKAYKYKPVGKHIKTKWSKNFKPENVLPEHPRPQLHRKEWMNLNGLWDYTITRMSNENERNNQELPTEFPNKILVPFGLESSLSGVGKTVTKFDLLWYHTKVVVPWDGKKVLHCGAVDYESTFFINGKKAFEHIGGYSEFEFEIEEKEFDLVIKVWDPTDCYDQPRGKQVNKAGGIWYTSITGIWQTVWIEPVHNEYITYVQCIPNIDNKTLSLSIEMNTEKKENEKFIVEIKEKDKEECIQRIEINERQSEIQLEKEMKLWTPETPQLYDIVISMENGERIESYFAMRKFGKGTHKGYPCFTLNNEPIFMFGYLDQGYWPDGLYTAPTDEALRSDVEFAKKIGVNLLRKHAKTEPMRWYYHCDVIGIIVWQDMPSRSSDKVRWNEDNFCEEEDPVPPETKRRFINEWNAIRKWIGLSPSVSCWIPFNENWGQFDTRELVEISRDSQRLVNSASGGNHFKNLGDVCDCHSYPAPRMKVVDDRIRVVGEYGGVGKGIDQHTWIDANWGYIQSENVDEVYEEYIKLLVPIEGLAGAIYTQLTDVEAEVNGLMTYDRAIIKVNMERMNAIHQYLFEQMK